MSLRYARDLEHKANHGLAIVQRLKSWLLEPFHKNLREQTNPAPQPFE
jgi:hypothetical protein